MTKQNIVDLDAYREEQQLAPAPTSSPAISEELKEAIDSLIHKLRSQEPQAPE